MERLKATEPEVKVTDEQRAALADVESRFRAKIAEREVFLKGLIDQAVRAGNYGEIGELQEQLAREISRLNQEREEAKDRVRAGEGGTGA